MRRARLAALAALLLVILALPVRAAVVEAGPSGFTTRNEVIVQASPAVAWQALLRPALW